MNDLNQNNAVTQATPEQPVKPKKKGGLKAVIIIVAVLVVLGIAVGFLWNPVIQPYIDYDEAVEYIEAGKYKKALRILRELGDFKDSKDLIKNEVKPGIKYDEALEHIENEEYDEAYALFVELDDYKDSKQMLEKFVLRYSHASETGKHDSSGYYEDYYFEYDEKGRLAKKTVGDYYEYRYTYTYYEDGSLKKISEYLYDDFYRESNYNTNGDIIDEVYIDDYGDEAKTKYTYNYDAKGNKTYMKLEHITDGWTAEYYYQNVYGGGRLAEVKEYYSYFNGEEDIHTLVSTTVYEYDEEGNLIKETITYETDGAGYEEQVYEYNADGNMTRDCYYEYYEGDYYDEEYTYEYIFEYDQPIYIYIG